MEQLIKYGLIHCHSENSLKDSTMTPTQLVRRAKELGAPAVTLTDHGTLTGIYEFIRAAKEVGIKAIPGVEAYVKEDSDVRRMHLVLLAKNYKGYQAISRAVTKSNTRIMDDYPCFNMEIIEEFFGEGSVGHGNVIATSACVGGILSSILLRNSVLENEIRKLEAKAAKYSSPMDPVYLGNQKLLQEHGEAVRSLIAQRDELKKIASQKFSMRERAAQKLSGEAQTTALAAIAIDKEEARKADEELSRVKTRLSAAKKRETAARQAVKEAEKSHDKWNYFHKEIEKLREGVADESELFNDVRMLAMRYKSIFGDDFYIELQYHGIPDEAYVMPKLAQLAEEFGIPTVACNDAHFVTNDSSCVRARAIVSSLRFNKWNTPREDDPEYYIKTDEELRFWLTKILNEKTVEDAFLGIDRIVNACDVRFPKETHFPKFKGGIAGETAEGRLRRLTEEGIKARYPDGNFQYRDRVEYELEIINKMQYTDYLCIVQDYLAYGRSLGVDCAEGVGYAIGPGRGSAAGSLVCYLIGITSVDPMPLGLIFERFLNPDRVSSPDIDADLSMEVRDRVLQYVKSKYGDEAVCCIMTKGTLAAKAAIKAVARIRGTEVSDDPRKFLNLGDAICKLIPNDSGVKLADCETELRAAFADDLDGQAIISDAMLVEGAAINYGMHAAGVIIADNGDVGEYVPMLWNSKKVQWCSQCDMVEAEAQAGLLKFDFLGLRNLDIITTALRLIKRNTGIAIDIEKVPQESVIYREIFAKGRTNFIFQFESDGMKNLLRKFKPENLEHIVLLNAVFRPGPLQYADAICETKAGKRKPTYVCDAAKDVLKVTYGYPVYQEQIMQLCNKVAGFTLGQSDMIRRAMSKKKVDKMAEYKPKFIDGLVDSGADRQAAEEFWEQLMDFAKYAFNKSHAAVYATIAYYTAWLKYHYPTEYMTAVMNYTPIKKLPMMVEECRSLAIRLTSPSINDSDIYFTGRDGVIQFGMNNIKGVGSGGDEILKERSLNGPFRSYKDFLTRCMPKKDVCEALIDAGALDCWCGNRKALKAVFGDLMDDLKKANEKRAIAASETDERKRLNAEKKAKEYQARFDNTILPISIFEDKAEKLSAENELLGMYISGHPLDDYPDAKRLRSCSIGEANTPGKYVTFCGFVRSLRVTKRKSDGKQMAFFTLEDETGEAEGCVFTRAYGNFGHILEDGVVIIAEGKFDLEVTGEEDDSEEKKKIFIESARILKPKRKKVLVTVFGLVRWTESVYPQLIPYSNPDGLEVVIYDSALGEFRTTTLRVTTDVLDAEIDDADIVETDI